MKTGNMSEKTNRKVTDEPISPDMYTGSAKEKGMGDRQRDSSVRSRSGGSNDGTRERKMHTLKRRSASREVERNKSSSSSSRKQRDREEKRRHRRRSSSSSSSNEFRSRSSYAAGDRKMRRKKYRRQNRSTSSDDNSDRCIGGRSAHDHESYKFQEPNKTIMVRGLAMHHTENDIKADVQSCGLLPKDIRLIRSRDTGESRGFAFVEFFSVVDATRWMDIRKGLIVFSDQYQANVIYSISKGCTSASKEETDWYCEKCRGHNFKRREFCYKCYSPRKDSDGQHDINSQRGDPTSTIILGNLDTLTTEADILQAFQLRADVACLPIKSVKIAREPVTTISKGICYVEANCISEAISLFSVLNSEDLIIDGRQVSVAYSKVTHAPSPGSNSMAASALAAAQWTNSVAIPKGHIESTPPCLEIKTMDDVQKMAKYYAKLYAKTFDEYSSYFEYYRQYFLQEISQDSSEGRLETGFSNPKLPTMSSLNHQSATAIVNPNDSVVVVPGSQEFVQAAGIQDNRSNTDRDCSLDLKSDFYETRKDLSRKSNKRKEQKVESNTKVTDAQRITKKMEKWAKTFNEKKDELMKQTSKSAFGGTSISTTSSDSMSMLSDNLMPSATESGVPNYLEENYVFAVENSNTYQPVDCTMATAGNPGSVRSSTACVVDELDPSSFVDESKLVCLLCKRRFSSKDILLKHVTKSDMHQKNLLELRPRQRY